MQTGNFEDDMAKIRDCDWVIEVVVENMSIKKRLMTEKIVPNLTDGAIFTSNTSGLSINEMAEVLPESIRKNFLATHFFNPPLYMRLLELVPSRYTDPDVLDFMADFCSRRLGKGIVYCKDTPNFIANRIGVFAICNAVHHMVEMGMTINRLCSSGLQAIALAAERIQAGWADCIIAGGAESMTCVPLGGNKYVPNPRMVVEWPKAYMNMGLTAELVAGQYGVTREEQDAFAVASHAKAAAAIAAGSFGDEIIPVEVEHAAPA